MIKLNYSNLFKIDQKHSISNEEISARGELIPQYLEKIHARNQGFYSIIDHHETIDRINEYAEHVKGRYKSIVVLGIGGSSLGAITLKESLTHLYQSQTPDNKTPNLYILDNIDPQLIAETESVLHLPDTLFLVITKSGETPETLAQFFYFYDKIKAANLEAKDHFVAITDPNKGLLREIATSHNFPSFEVPENVGGRFSVLTPVGLLPAALIGINIQELINDAQEMRYQFLNKDFKENLPFQIATIQYLLYKKGKTINVLMPYTQKLFRFADWYRQLLAESTGKKFNNNQEEVYLGITPINALGATDQHSQSQLYNEGPNDKLIIFLQTLDKEPALKIPTTNLVDETDTRIAYLKTLNFKTLLDTEMQGTIDSLTSNDRPNILLQIDKLNAENLGGLFMLFECATAFLGEYMEINAFDQPGVELSKQLTKKLLS